MNLQDAQKQLQDLQEAAKQLQYAIPKDWLSDPLKYANEIAEKFVEWDDELKIINNDLLGLNSILKQNLQDLTSSNVMLLQSRKATRDLSSISQSLLNDRNKIADLDKKQLEKLKNQTKISNTLLEQSKNSGDLTVEQLAATEDNLRLGKQLLDITQQRLNLEDNINKKMGLAPAIADGLSKSLNKIGFGGLAQQLKLDEAISKTREYIKENNGNVSSMSVLGKFSGNVLKNLTGMLSPANLLQMSVGLLVNSMMNFDKMAGDTAKTLGISYKEASKINQELTQVAASSSNTFVTTKSLVEAQNALNSSLGTSTQLNEELLTTYTELTKQAGYSVESATTLSKLSLITGKSSKDLTTTYLGQVKALNLKNGLAINEKALLNDISNVSKATLVTFAQNPKELAKAAFEAKKVGLELKQIEGIQSSLLDIESSIGAEFEAEVMTGKALNLERARYYALTNDISGLSQEISKQNITASSFANMNVLQQEAIAKAIGMSREEMGNMLIEQNALSKLGLKDTEENKRRLAMLKERGFSDKAIAEMGAEQLKDQMASVTTQEKFLALTEKLQEVFISMAGPIMDVVSPLMDLVSIVITPIANGFTAIKEIISSILDPTKSLSETLANMGPLTAFIAGGLTAAGVAVTASLVPGLIRTAAAAAMALPSMISMAIAAISTASATTLGIGAIAIVGGIAAAVTAMNSAKSTMKMNDGIVNPDGGMVLSGPKGSIQLNKDDSVVAGTNLFGGNQSEGNISQLSSTLNNKLDQLIGEVRTMTNELKKGMTVNLDGNRVSSGLLTPIAINSRKV
jgi:hypothetical protein